MVDAHTQQAVSVSAQSRTPRSFMTAIRADLGEAEAYRQALLRGEIGLQRPMGANVRGVDFVTAVRDGAAGVREVVCSDAKSSGSGRFPKAKATIPGSWQAEVRDATTRPRLRLQVLTTDIPGGAPGFPIPFGPLALQQLEDAIIAAVAAGKVRLRQLNADYSPAGQGLIVGW
jgi:hypothetical protein